MSLVPPPARATLVRRAVGVLAGLALTALTVALALRWADLTVTAVVIVQSVVPLVGAGIVAVTLIALLLRHRRLRLAGALISLVVLALVINALLPSPQRTTAHGPSSFTVLASNLLLGEARAEDVVAAARDRHADVVVLLEVTPAAVARLAADGLDAALPYVAGHAEPGATGTLVRSRWPLTVLDEGRADRGASFAFWQPVVRVSRPAGDVVVRAIHAQPPVPSVDSWRISQEALGAWQRAQPAAEPLVMAGDFNASAGHPAYRLMSEGLVDAHRSMGQGWVRTWPEGRRYPAFVQLDHVLSRGFQVVDAGTAVIADTDHAAVWATLVVG